MSDFLDLSDEEQNAIIERDAARYLDDPMPAALNRQVADAIEPHTINARIKHSDVMDCIHVAWPLIQDYFLREWVG